MKTVSILYNRVNKDPIDILTVHHSLEDARKHAKTVKEIRPYGKYFIKTLTVLGDTTMNGDEPPKGIVSVVNKDPHQFLVDIVQSLIKERKEVLVGIDKLNKRLSEIQTDIGTYEDCLVVIERAKGIEYKRQGDNQGPYAEGSINTSTSQETVNKVINKPVNITKTLRDYLEKRKGIEIRRQDLRKLFPKDIMWSKVCGALDNMKFVTKEIKAGKERGWIIFTGKPEKELTMNRYNPGSEDMGGSDY